MVKRITSIEEGPDVFAELAFNDTDMSVYLVEDEVSEITRAHAEHAAGFLARPAERYGVALSTTPPALSTLEECPGETGFQFTTDRHREIRFIDLAEAHEAGRAVFPTLASAHRNLDLASLKAYARARLLERDTEWETICSESTKIKWRKCIGSGS